MPSNRRCPRLQLQRRPRLMSVPRVAIFPATSCAGSRWTFSSLPRRPLARVALA